MEITINFFTTFNFIKARIPYGLLPNTTSQVSVVQINEIISSETLALSTVAYIRQYVYVHARGILFDHIYCNKDSPAGKRHITGKSWERKL